MAQGVPRDHVYDQIFYVLATLLVRRGGPDAKAFIAWALVGLPLAWGVWKTLENAAKILQ